MKDKHMINTKQIIEKYMSFFEERKHKRIDNSSLVPQNDPTTLFTSSGMQPLIPYLLGETHPLGKRLVNVQNCFRAQDIEEVGDNRHTTFFRMLGNWSLGDYYKKEQLLWFFEFLTKELKLPINKLYVSVFSGYDNIPKDKESFGIWQELFSNSGIDPKDRIYLYDTKNWWSRTGEPQNMPSGEPGGPDSEVFYDFETSHDSKYGKSCNVNCQCGRFMEIGNSVFMEYVKKTDGSFTNLPKKNVDFGGGLERLLAAVENQQDIFQTSLFKPIVKVIEEVTSKQYADHKEQIRIITDHLVAAVFIISNGITPSNKEQGYILRRLIRRGFDNFHKLDGKDISPIIEAIVGQYKNTDPYLVDNYEKIKGAVLEEANNYHATREKARILIQKRYQKIGSKLMDTTEITAEDAFLLYTTHGLSPSQIESLGFAFDRQEFAQKMKAHQDLSRQGAKQKFAGGLADHQKKTIMGHTATHLLHQALRDVLGNHVHQTGSNITAQRARFDFNYDRKLTDEELQRVEKIVNEKIKENLPVHFEILSQEEAEELGAIGLFKNTYAKKVKIYIIGKAIAKKDAYSIEYCGGPHVDFTGRLKGVKIIKQENIGHGQRRIYAIVEAQ